MSPSYSQPMSYHGTVTDAYDAWVRSKDMTLSAEKHHKMFGVLPLPSEGDFPMQRYVHEENILLYRKLLAETTDEEKRKIILRLLAEEEAKELPASAKKK